MGEDDLDESDSTSFTGVGCFRFKNASNFVCLSADGGLDIRAFLDVLGDGDGELGFLSGVWPLTNRNLEDVIEVGIGVEWD